MGGIKSVKILQEHFIKKCIDKFGDKYDYSKVKYKNYIDKVIIICPEHGEFLISPNAFLRSKYGCPKCAIKGMSKTLSMTQDDFIERAKQIHGNKYDYSKVNYVNNYTKVCIICPKHGEFWQKAGVHLRGAGCKKCALENDKSNTQEFIEKAKQVHGDKYDYRKVDYINSDTKVCIICPEHGEFWQTPSKHLYKRGCPDCGKIRTRLAQLSNTQEFIEKARKIHGDRYDYSKVRYKHNQQKVCIICPEHGEFWVTPNDHLSGKQGCPNCRTSKLENKIINSLQEKNITYIHEANKRQFNWLGKQRLDFYLPEYNIAIECQGNQHFKVIDYYGGKEQLEKQIKNDKKKYIKCLEHNIKVLYYVPDIRILENDRNIIYKNNNVFSDEELQSDISIFT